MLFAAKYAKNFDLSRVRFSDPVHNTIAEYVKMQQKNGERVRASALFELIEENDPELSQILDLSLGDSLEGEGAARYFADSVRAVERAQTEEELDALSARFDAETDLAERRNLTRRILELTLKLKTLN